ncbi:uncharacterized protein [Spinacia oleracea]|uniref:Reverse transcriptase zinc-binding domain-containing protein n=1 Tax=Spinacia oleracea TaxID=3562 RepID=A0A9R0IRZ9_SPIOL|nr:uncharacterized protein LOC110793862 [Spinacia oleracea]
MPIPSQASWLVRKILSVRDYLLSFADGIDVLSDASFSVKNVYSVLRGDVQKVEWRKLTCNNPAPPKCIFIVWLDALNKMVTCDRLIKIGIACEPICCLCEKASENVCHLFFECEYSASVWSCVLQWFGVNRRPRNWEEEMQFIVTQFKSNSVKHQMYRMMVSVVVYLLWRERNQRKFKLVKSNSETIVKEAQYMIYSRSLNVSRLACCLP